MPDIDWWTKNFGKNLYDTLLKYYTSTGDHEQAVKKATDRYNIATNSTLLQQELLPIWKDSKNPEPVSCVDQQKFLLRQSCAWA